MVCPEAALIAITTTSAAVLLIGAMYILMIRRNKRKLEEQRGHLKHIFAQRLVAAFDIYNGGEALSLEALAGEFKAIDSDGNGKISKAVSFLEAVASNCCAF